MRAPQITPGAVLKGILGLQLGIAGIMFGVDILDGVQDLSFRGPAAPPRLESPVSPGDQTRRYRPGDLPEGPRDRPYPPVTEMPARLMFDPLTADGEPVLRLTGEIAPGDGTRFADWLEAAAEPPAKVLLHSPGGSVNDALEIGAVLRTAGLNTEIAPGDICLSACPYVLMAGVERQVSAQGYVGVHQHYFGKNTVQPAFMAVDDIQRGQAQVMEYLDSMGIDPMVMRHGMATPPDDIYILVPEELERYRIVTGTGDDTG